MFVSISLHTLAIFDEEAVPSFSSSVLHYFDIVTVLPECVTHWLWCRYNVLMEMFLFLAIHCTLNLHIVYNRFDWSWLQAFVVAIELRIDYFEYESLYAFKIFPAFVSCEVEPGWCCVLHCWKNVQSVSMSEALFVNAISFEFGLAMTLWPTAASDVIHMVIKIQVTVYRYSK